MQSTDFRSIVSPIGVAQRRRFDAGGSAIYTGNGPAAPSAPAAPTAPGGYMPTVSTVSSDLGISPAYGKIAQSLIGALAPPLGMAMTGYNTVAQANNVANNASMLSQMGDPLGVGQILGGVLGLNGYGGTSTDAMNAAMNSDAGRQALSTSQAGGELPGVSMPTQTAPTVSVSSEPLGAPASQSTDNSGDQGDGHGQPGASTSGPSGMAGTGGNGAANGTGGEGGLARGGQVRGPHVRGGRGRPTNVVIVMPHPIMGALMLAALHQHAMQRPAATGALQAGRR